MITKTNVEQAIVDIYSVHVGLYGYDRNVFSIATKIQVAKYLDVPTHWIDNVISAKSGYARFKEEVLVRAGYGRRTGSSPVDIFLPNEEDVQ